MNNQVERNFKEEAKIFKAFCDENRLRILDMLSSSERCACELLEELDVVQSTLSHHMKILSDSGIVNTRKEGKWSHYSIDEKMAEKAKELLSLVLKNNSSHRVETIEKKGCRCD